MFLHPMFSVMLILKLILLYFRAVVPNRGAAAPWNAIYSAQDAAAPWGAIYSAQGAAG